MYLEHNIKEIISHEPQKIFLQSLHHLKDLSRCDISCTDMTPIWPLLPVETGSWIFQKIISHEPQKIFLQSLHHLKDLSLYYILYTDMTLIWPLLLVENGRSRKQKYSEVLFRMYCVHPVPAQRAFPPHTIIVCAHIQHEAVVFNQVARWTELHVYM